MKIGFIGLGKLGLPCAEVIAIKGHDVRGYDIVETVNDTVTVCPTIQETVQNRDIVFIAVPTPHHPDYDGKAPTSHLEPKDFGYDIVIDCIREANAWMNTGQLLVLISTVLPGIGTWDECECIKVFYNTFISTKIALVNMIQDVAVQQGNINVNVVTDALSQATQRIISPAYMTAGMGDGGACHPRDNIALRFLAEKLDLGYDMFDAIMIAREQQARNMAIEILKHGNRIQFSSDSYKPGVEYTDGSYSLLVQHYVKELSGQIVDSNPLVYVLVHPTCKPINNVYNFDPWNNYGVKYET